MRAATVTPCCWASSWSVWLAATVTVWGPAGAAVAVGAGGTVVGAGGTAVGAGGTGVAEGGAAAVVGAGGTGVAGGGVAVGTRATAVGGSGVGPPAFGAAVGGAGVLAPAGTVGGRPPGGTVGLAGGGVVLLRPRKATRPIMMTTPMIVGIAKRTRCVSRSTKILLMTAMIPCVTGRGRR